MSNLSTNLDIVTAHVDMVGSQVKICSRYCTHSPFCLAGEGITLVVACCTGDNLVTVLVYRTCSGRSQLKSQFDVQIT